MRFKNTDSKITSHPKVLALLEDIKDKDLTVTIQRVEENNRPVYSASIIDRKTKFTRTAPTVIVAARNVVDAYSRNKIKSDKRRIDLKRSPNKVIKDVDVEPVDELATDD